MTQHDPWLIRDDCRLYRGDRPCRFNRLCAGCPHYQPTGRRVCIIKLGALGDVIRTLCILPYLKQQDPDCRVTWVTSPAALAFIADHPQIDHVVGFDGPAALALQQQRFDTLISLDKEPEPTALAMAIDARRKLGIGMAASGKPVPLNAQARRYFALGLCDELKFHKNQATYPQLIYEAMGWPYHGQAYRLPLSEEDRAAAAQVLGESGWSTHGPTVGINVGAATTFANKMWPVDRLVDLLGRLRAAEPQTQLVLLGGPAEQQRMQAIAQRVPACIHPGNDHPAGRFVGLIDHCDVVFCGDTLAMHLAIARRRGVVAFFGPTCSQEIDLFGLGEKLVADVPCGPCYKRRCDRADACLNAVSTADALSAIRRVLSHRLAGRRMPCPLPQAG